MRKIISLSKGLSVHEIYFKRYSLMENIWIFLESAFIQGFIDDTSNLRSPREIIILGTVQTTYQNGVDTLKTDKIL